MFSYTFQEKMSDPASRRVDPGGRGHTAGINPAARAERNTGAVW